MLLPFLIFLGVGLAAGVGLFEYGHGQDPHGLSVAETLKLHWQAMWHHAQAASASDPGTAAAHLAAARDATTQMAPQVSSAATSATNDLDRARSVALSDLMAANAHLTVAMAALVQAKEQLDATRNSASRSLVQNAQREVDIAITRVQASTAQLVRLGIRVPGIAHA